MILPTDCGGSRVIHIGAEVEDREGDRSTVVDIVERLDNTDGQWVFTDGSLSGSWRYRPHELMVLSEPETECQRTSRERREAGERARAAVEQRAQGAPSGSSR